MRRTRRGLAIALSVGLAAPCACRHELLPPPEPAPLGGVVREVTLDRGFLLVRIEPPAGATGPRPAVISLLGERELLLAAGFVVVTYRIDWEPLKALAPPAAAPENTVGVWLLAAPTAKTVGQGFFGIISANSRGAVPRVLDHLASVPEVDPRRVGLVGSSTHGFVALEAAVDPRITAVAAVAACGDYHGFLHRSSLAMNGAPLDLDPTYAAWLRDQEPVTRAGELTHAAILLINGADDAAVPASCARATADVLRRAYERAHAAERFRFLLVPGAGHNDLGPLAREQMLAWLLRWLAAAGGVTSDRGSDAHRRPRAAGRAARPPGR